MKRASLAVAIGLAGLWLAGCSEQPNVVPSRNLDRPTDMVMGCMGLITDAEGKQRVSGRPMPDCHPVIPTETPADTTRRTFGFVANTARGELSVIDLDRSRLVDLEPGVTGFNTAPLGLLPEAMDISADGCRVVTANRGSCDLSIVDPGELMLPKLAREAEVDLPGNVGAAVATIKVTTGQGAPLHVAPYEVHFLPQNVFRKEEEPLWCPAGARVADPARPWRALVTFPSCDLVAMIDIPSGTILDSVFVRAAADGKSVVLEPGGANPSCPTVDCGPGPRPVRPAMDAAADTVTDGGIDVGAADAGGGASDSATADTDDGGADDGGGADGGSADAAAADGAATDGGPPPRPPVRVVDEPFIGVGALGTGALAIHPNGKRAYVGLANASFVAAITVGDGTLAAPPTGASIYLHEGALGSNRIRLSVDRFNTFVDDKPNGQLYLGQFVGEKLDASRRFLYVIARDGTVRVIHVADIALPETECDTNIDPLLVPNERETACFPVDPQRRKVLAVGPGIPVPSLPRDIAVADLTAGDHDELAVDGAYAFILTSTGTVYIVNIDPTARNTSGFAEGQAKIEAEELPLVNTLRDWNVVSYSRQLATVAGPARVDVFPPTPPFGPRIEGYYATDSKDNAAALGVAIPTYVFFPDRSAVTGQTWSVAWEGPLFPDPRYGAQVIGDLRTAAGTPTLEFVVRDRGGGFCRLGVQPGDVVTLEGCADNSQCGTGQVCVPSTAGTSTAGGLPIKGLCLSPDPVIQAQKKIECRRLLESVRRYEVVRAHPTELVVRPRVDELVKTSLDRCETDIQCQPSSDPSRKGFACVDHRCVLPCKADENCRAGRKCVLFVPDPDPAKEVRLCADGPELTQECFPQVTTYRVHAGRSFLVRGSVSVPPNTTLTAPDPNPGRFNYPRADPLICVDDPARNPVLTTRLSMDSPACRNITGVSLLNFRARPDNDSTSNGQVLQIARTTPDPNPCLFMGGPTEGDPPETPNDMLPEPTHVRALFQNAEIRFVISNLEQAFTDNREIRFEVHGGFRPQSVLVPTDSIDIGMPARLLVSPLTALVANGIKKLPFLFVVDQRRLGRTRGSTPTRGQVLRIHPQGPFQRQPIYQDFNATSGLYPIQ